MRPILFFVKGRAINKVLTLLMATIGIIIIFCANLVVKKDRALSDTLVIAAMIFFGFSFFHSIMWFIYYQKEKKKQEELSQTLSVIEPKDEVQSSLDYVEVDIPADELLGKARKRFYNGLKLGIVINIIFFIGLMALAIRNGQLGEISTIFIIGIGSTYSTIIYLCIQTPAYQRYKKTIPRRITFRTGILAINEKQYYADDITKIDISSDLKGNIASTKYYRTITVYIKNKKDVYCVDFRDQSKKSIRYSGYKELIEHFRNWSCANQVELKVDFMN